MCAALRPQETERTSRSKQRDIVGLLPIGHVEHHPGGSESRTFRSTRDDSNPRQRRLLYSISPPHHAGTSIRVKSLPSANRKLPMRQRTTVLFPHLCAATLRRRCAVSIGMLLAVRWRLPPGGETGTRRADGRAQQPKPERAVPANSRNPPRRRGMPCSSAARRWAACIPRRPDAEMPNSRWSAS